MFKFLSPERAARQSARHPLIVLGLWAVLIVAALGGASVAKVSHNAVDNASVESERARAAIEQAQGKEPARETVVITSRGDTVESPAYRSFVTGLAGRFAALPDAVAGVATYYDTNDQSMV